MESILILDFGSQVTQLIARRLRQLNVYCEIHPYNWATENIRKLNPKGIILSGGPSSILDKEAPKRKILELKEIAPLLGICYGMQIISSEFGGEVEPASDREYGLNEVTWSEPLGNTVPLNQKVWMSHGDIVKKIPPDFKLIATSESGHPAVIKGPGVLAVQFHPEVSHTIAGVEILKEFVFNWCSVKPDWDPGHIYLHIKEELLKKIPDGEKVLCALSGGVDSTVVGTLLTKILGPERVHCVFVDTGMLRAYEFEEVLKMYNKLGLNVKGVDAKKEFLDALEGVEDPETKRKIIGRKFIEIFEKETIEFPVQWLAQGTLYPDVIESVSPRGASVTIKSHHNVGGLPEKMKLKLVEPLRELFKDEVRELGGELGIPKSSLWRHPFPGPGLAIRIIGTVNQEDLDILKECDRIYINSLKESDLYDKIWQAFCVLLPVKTVGVQGDARSYERVLALRAVTSNDGMTADWYPFDGEFLKKLSNKICNQVKGVNRVVYDITSKPPATIEWE